MKEIRLTLTCRTEGEAVRFTNLALHSEHVTTVHIEKVEKIERGPDRRLAGG